MEDRSPGACEHWWHEWRVRGLAANQIARALISMMARSTTCSNQRPDTLMRDRICRIDENLLQRPAGALTCDGGLRYPTATARRSSASLNAGISDGYLRADFYDPIGWQTKVARCIIAEACKLYK